MKKKLVKCKACGEEIAAKAKKCPKCGAKNKKPIFKKWWFWLIVVIVIGSLGNNNDNATEPVETTPVTKAIEETTPATETIVETTFATEAAVEETEPSVPSIVLVAGEAGEYGELFTMNKGTEFEETYYIYRIPAGTYTVTNVGEYMNQFNVYSDEIHVTEDGWEEPAEVIYVKLLDVGASDTFTIAEGQYIEIHEPANFELVLVAE